MAERSQYQKLFCKINNNCEAVDLIYSLINKLDIIVQQTETLHNYREYKESVEILQNFMSDRKFYRLFEPEKLNLSKLATYKKRFIWFCEDLDFDDQVLLIKKALSNLESCPLSFFLFVSDQLLSLYKLSNIDLKSKYLVCHFNTRNSNLNILYNDFLNIKQSNGSYYEIIAGDVLLNFYSFLCEMKKWFEYEECLFFNDLSFIIPNLILMLDNEYNKDDFLSLGQLAISSYMHLDSYKEQNSKKRAIYDLFSKGIWFLPSQQYFRYSVCGFKNVLHDHDKKNIILKG